MAVPPTPTNMYAYLAGPGQVLVSWNSNGNTDQFGPGNTDNYYEVERATGAASTSFSVVSSSSQFTLSGQTYWYDTTVLPNTVYRYKVRAHNVDGYSGYATVAPNVINGLPFNTYSAGSTIYNADTAARIPNVVTNLTATVISSTEIDLAWLDNSDNEQYFLVRRVQTAPVTVPSALIASVAANTTTYNDTTLLAGSTYYYIVTPISLYQGHYYYGSDNTSAQKTTSSSVSITAPTNLVAVIESGPQMKLTWNDNSNNETGFQLERAINGGSFSVLVILGANVKTYTDTGIAVGNQYTYRIKAFNASATSTYSNQQSWYIAEIYSVNSNLSAFEYGIQYFYGPQNSYSSTAFLPRNTVIRDNDMSNNGMGNLDPDIYVSPTVTIDNPSVENLYIRRGVTIYS